MSRKLVLFCCTMLIMVFAASALAQNQPDDPRWNRSSALLKSTDPSSPARLDPSFKPNTTTRVVTTPNEVLLVDPNVRPRPNTGYHQSEVNIYAQSTDRNIMFGASHNIRSSTINVATFITTNGGQTWYGGDTLADFNTQRGDPAPLIDKNGVFIYGHLNSSANFGSVTGMGMNYSTNRGITWSPTFPIANAGGGDADKNAVGTDESPYSANSYMAWTKFTSGNLPAVILVSRSTDAGATWSSAQQVNTAASTSFSQGTDVATSPTGDVYICWAEESSTSPYPSVSVGFAKSTNGGTTWGFTNTAYATSGMRSASYNGWAVRVNDFPRMAVDKTGSGRNGWIYIVEAEQGGGTAGSDADIVLHRSTDGGTTWSSGIRVNQDPINDGKKQFFPAVCVDPGGGINVAYYDNRNYASVGDSCEIYVSRSLDGGSTWTDVKASDHAFKPKNVPGVNSMGDYMGITAGSGKVWPMWMDDRSGFYDVWTVGIQTTEGFGWVKGNVTNVSGGAALSNVSIDFTNPIPQTSALTDPTGFYKAGAKVDTPGTTRSVTLRARKFGFRDTLISITLTRNDTLTRNFAMTPVPNGTLVVRTVRRDSTNIRSAITVLFNGGTVASGNTDSLTGIYSTVLPLGSYDVLVDPPSPYGNRRFNGVVVATGSNPLYVVVRAVIENSPAAMRDTLAVGGLHTKVLQLTNSTATDTVGYRLSDDNALARARMSKPAAQPREVPIVLPERPKGAPDTEFGDSPNGGGGPDAFGYRWVDSDSAGGGVTYNWVEISSVGTPVTTWSGSTDDGSFSTTLPWSFPYYGNGYTNFFFTTNGWLGFNAASTQYSNVAIPNVAEPNNAIYAWWDDLDAVGTSGDRTVYYYNDVANSRYIVQYNNVRHLSAAADTFKFQAILKPNGEILLQYNRMVGTTNLTSATIGIENADGSTGLQVVYNAAYIHNGLAIKFYLPDAAWISESPSFGRINPGATQNITVTFDAAGLLPGTTYTGKILLDVTHPDVTGSTLIPASLKVNPASGPVIILSKTSLTFPVTEIGFSRQDSLMARNGGTAALTLSSLTTTNSRFTVLPTSGSIPPGDSLKIRVTYTSIAPARADTGRVIILNNDPVSPRRDVTLSGTALGVAHFVVRPDTFAFTRNPTVDTTRTTFKVFNTGTDTLRYDLREANTSPLADAAAIQRSMIQHEANDLPKGAMDPTPGETDSSGGPDAFGYRWIDSDSPGGPQFTWVDITSGGTQITAWTSGTADDGSVIVPLPFSFSFYGASYNQLKVCTNGWVGFDIASTSNAYSNVAIPAVGEPNNAIYPFWDDMNLSTSGTVHYYSDVANSRFIVQYTNVPHYGTTEPGLYTFEVMLYANGRILVQYLDMQQTLISATIGLENTGGTIALQTVYNSAYMHNNLALLFTSDIVTWMSTDRTSGVVAPGDSQAVQLRIHPFGSPVGNYYGVQRVTGNTPDVGRVRVGLRVITGVGDNPAQLPTEFALSQNYPNPFNPTTKIKYNLPEQATVVLKIYNLLGQEVATLADAPQAAGYYEATWDGRNNFGTNVSSGVYFYRFEATGNSGQRYANLKKMLFLK